MAEATKLWHTLTDAQQQQIRSGKITVRVVKGGAVVHGNGMVKARDQRGRSALGRSPRLAVEALPK